MRPAAAGPRGAQAARDLRAFARFEGRAFPRAAEVAAELDISLSRAVRLLARIKTLGVAREVAILNLGPAACHSVGHIQARLDRPEAVRAFEQRLAMDPAVQLLSRVSGSFDYRVQAVHADARDAGVWFRDLLADPTVAGGRQQFIRVLFRQDAALAALLPAEADWRGAPGRAPAASR